MDEKRLRIRLRLVFRSSSSIFSSAQKQIKIFCEKNAADLGSSARLDRRADPEANDGHSGSRPKELVSSDSNPLGELNSLAIDDLNLFARLQAQCGAPFVVKRGQLFSGQKARIETFRFEEKSRFGVRKKEGPRRSRM